MITRLEPKEWMSLNAKLQKKKNALRKSLKEKGILQKEGKNTYDNYKYFSEAQYKMLFTELFSEHGLEIKFDEVEYGTFEGTEKQANGRMPSLQFLLFDVDTGFFETTTITGEGIDKGDKAGYKAYTGAVKYYLANTFLVATGDDAEKESPDHRMNTKSNARARKASDKQLAVLRQTYTGDLLTKLLETNGIEKLEDISMTKASELIGKLKERKENTNA